MIRSYYGDSALSVRFYDVVTSIDPSVRGDVDVNFYADCLHSPGQHVLEIGCGTGRVAIILAARGHFVIGIDNSEPMLERARMKCRKLSPNVSMNVQFLKYDISFNYRPVLYVQSPQNTAPQGSVSCDHSEAPFARGTRNNPCGVAG